MSYCCGAFGRLDDPKCVGLAVAGLSVAVSRGVRKEAIRGYDDTGILSEGRWVCQKSKSDLFGYSKMFLSYFLDISPSV